MRWMLMTAVQAVALCVAAPAFAQHAGHGGAAAGGDGDPPWSQADAYWDADAMAAARAQGRHEMGGMKQTMFKADRLEWRDGDGADALLWDGDAWHGGDIDKIWFKSEGEYSFDEGELEDAEVQALWSHAISAYWDVQAGLRQEFEPDGKTHAVLGVQGLAPYWFEVDAAAFVSTDGDLTARAEVEYDLRLTQRLILQPRAELELSAQEVADREIGTGFTGAAAGVRLRYEIAREVAPYVGVEWTGALGETARMIEAAGVDDERVSVVAGVRMWW